MRYIRAPDPWPRDAIRCALLSAVVLALLVLPLATGALHPSPGAEVRSSGGQWVVTEVDPDGVASLAGLRVGDAVVGLDGQQPQARRRTDPGLALGRARTWAVLRQETLLTLHPSTSGLPWASRAEPFLLLAIALIAWGVGLFARLSKPGNDLTRWFCWLSLAVAMALALSTPAGDDVLWAKTLEVLAFALLPGLFLGFFLRLGLGMAPDGFLARVVSALFFGGLASGALYLVAGLLDSPWYDVLRLALLAFLALGFVGALVALFQGYRQPSSPEVRRQIRVVLIGTGFAVLPLTVLCLLPETAGMPPVVRPQFAAFGIVFLPFSFAYAILRYQLLGIEVIVRRALVYGTLTLLLAGCYALFLEGLAQLTRRPAMTDNAALSLIFFAILTVSFVPVRDCVCWLVDHLIYRDRYDCIHTLRTLDAQLASVQPIDQTLNAVVDNLRGAMNLRGAAVLLRGPDGEVTLRAASGDVRCSGPGPSVVGGGANCCGRNLSAKSSWIPLNAYGDERGFLYLAPKCSGAGLTDQDRDLTEMIAGEVAIAVTNTLLVERLQAKVDELEILRDRLLGVQEAERKRLAREIHDGPLHTVLDLVRRTDAVAEAALASASVPTPLGEHLRDLAERGRDAAHELRALCADLYPSELTHLGLVAALESVIERTNRDENLVVALRTDGFPENLRLPAVLEDVLYRVAREALDNACRHAEATAAWVDLAKGQGQVTLSIRDDGRGFAAPTTTSALVRQGHLGLASMRERIEGLRGDFVIVSRPGAGTLVRVRVNVPIDYPNRPDGPYEAAL